MKPRETIKIPYTIGEQFLFYVRYGDTEQLSSVEVEQFDELTTKALGSQYKFSHWVVTEGREECAKCEATDGMGACMKIQAVYFHTTV
jgi:hypothetical protein